MKWVFRPLLLVLLALSLPAEPAKTKPEPTKTKPPQHKPAASSTSKSASGKSVSSSQKSARNAHARSRHVKHAPAPSYQLHPYPDRYAEIQKALADRGYFKGEVNGQWNDDSVDALKRFQADQKLDNDGKINSLTLIGLGLGPKHDGSFVAPHPPSASVTQTAPVAQPAPSSSTETTPPPSAPPN